MRSLNVLIACEESGAVRDAFRNLGHNAWSCDLQPCDPASKYSAYHVEGDATALLPRCNANMYCAANGWDLLIAHPPCTYLTNSGVTWLFKNPDRSCTLWRQSTRGQLSGARVFRYANPARVAAMRAGAQFFYRLWNAHIIDHIPHVAVENPIMHGYGRQECAAGNPDQIIQPWMFGHYEQKATCLWLRHLPKLKPHDNAQFVRAAMMLQPYSQRNRLHFLSPSKDRAKLRSKTYKGIALAMATQWSEYILNQ